MARRKKPLSPGGRKLEKLRKQLGLTQKQCVGLKQAVRTYQRWITGSPPSREVLLRDILSERMKQTEPEVIDSVLVSYKYSPLTSRDYQHFKLSAPQNDLVAFYTFAGNARDASGNANNGEEVGKVEYVTIDGLSAVRFDGSTAYIEVAPSPSLQLRRFTIAAWIESEHLGQSDPHHGHRVLEKGSSGGFWLSVTEEGRAIVGFYDGEMQEDVISDAILRQRQRTFLVGTFDGQFLRVYVNGSLMNERTFKTYLVPPHNDEPLRIGWKYHGSRHDRFAGIIYEVRLYNRALDAKEIKDLYRGSTAASSKPE